MTFSLTCMARELADALNAVAPVVNSSINSPLLKGIRIRAGAGVAYFEGTNRDQSIRAQCAAEVSGEIILDAAALAAKANLLKMDQSVKFIETEAGVSISQGKTRWSLPPIRIQGFPDMWLSMPDLSSQSIPSEPLFQAIRMARPAVNPNADRVYLSGLFIDGSDGCHVVGTDGHVLHAVPTPIFLPEDWDGPIVPMRAADLLLSTFKGDDLISLAIYESALFASNGRTFLRSQLIEGSFPNWRGVLPKGLDRNFEVDGSELKYAISRASAIKFIAGSKSGSAGQFIRIRVAGSDVSCFASNTDGEQGEDLCFAQTVGEGEIGVTAPHVVDAIDTLGDGAVRVSYPGEAGKGFILIERVDGAAGVRVISQRLS